MTTYFLKNPIFAIVLNLMIFLGGLLSLEHLTVREYPPIPSNVVIVQTMYPLASASVVESRVTTPLEMALSGMKGILKTESESMRDFSHIKVTFAPGVALTDAMAELRERLSNALSDLPKEVNKPRYAFNSIWSDPFMTLEVSNESQLSDMEMSALLSRVVEPMLMSTPGLQNAYNRATQYGISVKLKPEMLAKWNFNISDIVGIIDNANKDLPAGEIKIGKGLVPLVSKSRVGSIEDFRNLVIKQVKSMPVRLNDVADVVFEPLKTTPLAFKNSKKTTYVSLLVAPEANPLEVSKSVRELLPRINEMIPQGIKITVVEDNTDAIRSSISTVYKTIFESIFCVSVVIFLFLGSMRLSFVPIVTIPLCLMGVLLLMYGLGYTINKMTLLAMVLAIGLVVDDAIVVLENVRRHYSSGVSAFEAAIKGSQEIGFAIIAMTLTLSCVYAPLLFSKGLTSQLFTEFAVVLAATVIISGIVALTLSPLMTLRVLRSSNHLTKAFEIFYDHIAIAYGKKLQILIAKPKLLLAFPLMIGIGVALLNYLPPSFIPDEDQNAIYGYLNAPKFKNDKELLTYSKRFEDILRSTDGVEEIYTTIWMKEHVLVTAKFKPRSDRNRPIRNVLQELRGKIKELIPTGNCHVWLPRPEILRDEQSDFRVIFQSTQGYDYLFKVVGGLKKKFDDSGFFEQSNFNAQMNNVELSLTMDQARLKAFNIESNAASKQLRYLFGGLYVDRMELKGVNYPIHIENSSAWPRSKDDIANVMIKQGEARWGASQEDQKKDKDKKRFTPLSAFTKIEIKPDLSPYFHFNKIKALSLDLSLKKDAPISKIMEWLNQQLKPLMSKDLTVVIYGNILKTMEAKHELYINFLLALVFIYLILSVQFKTFFDPLIILTTVPLSTIGGLLFIWLWGEGLNLYTQIGLITLVGLITKHGILIVSFAEDFIRAGTPLLEAITKASQLRLRPILMTTLAMMAGAIPLMIGLEPGFEARREFGLVLLGGLGIGSCLTLVLIPLVYYWLNRLKRDFFVKNKR